MFILKENFLHKIIQKYSYIFLVLSSLSVLLVMTGLAFFTFPSADDFCFSNLVKDKGVLGYLSYHYNNWNGRYASVFLLSSFFSYDFIKYYPFLAIAVLILTFLSFCILLYSIKKFSSSLNKINIFSNSLIITIIYFVLLPNLSQTLYWASGSLTFLVGNIFNILLLSLIFIYFNSKKYYSFILGVIIGIILIIAIVGSNELSMFVCIYLIILSCVFSKSYKDVTFFSFLLLAAFVLFFVVIFAPGNAIRINNLDEIYLIKPNVYFSASLFVVWSILRFLFWVTNATLLVYILSLFCENFSLSRSLKKIKNKIFLSYIIIIVGFLLLNLSGFLLQGLPLPERAESVITLYFLISIFFFVFTIKLVSPSIDKIKITLRKNKYIINYLLAALIIAHPNNFDLYKDIYHGYRFYLENKKRIDIIFNEKKKNNLDIVVPSLSKLPRHLVAGEITTNAEDIRNRCMANFYGVNSIVLGKLK